MKRLLRAAVTPVLAVALTIPLAASTALAGEPELLRLTAYAIDGRRLRRRPISKTSWWRKAATSS
jgi:hypothetical protein